MESSADELGKFLFAGAFLVTDAIFIIQSLPNVEIAAVQHASFQLKTLISALQKFALNDSGLSAWELGALKQNVETLQRQLDAFLCSSDTSPAAPTQRKPHVNHQGQAFRPTYVIDLDAIEERRWQGETWEDIATSLNVTRQTLYNHMKRAGRPTYRPYTQISDETLDTVVASIIHEHPFSGAVIVSGHLTARGLKIPHIRVQSSLRRVDPIGVMFRWSKTVRRRVYRVRGANALWHMDGNEKLRHWGFYVHGCVDGYSRQVIYLECRTNKKSATVAAIFHRGVDEFGAPSRVRGDFGTENNGVEKFMNTLRGPDHKAYLRGKSLHNIRIERLWRDVRKDCLEAFRRLFTHLENSGLLDMEIRLHRVALFLVFWPRIQHGLNGMRLGWNNHRLRGEGNKTPKLLFDQSRRQAIREGYWYGDPGDTVEEVEAAFYGVDEADDVCPPIHELEEDPDTIQEEIDLGIRVNSDSELEEARAVLDGYKFDADDGNSGIDIYQEVVLRLALVFEDEQDDAITDGFKRRWGSE